MLGYVAPRPPVVESQVAAPISARVVTAKRFCWTPEPSRYGFGEVQASDLGNYLPCSGAVPPRDNHPGLVIQGTLVIFSWTARRPVTSTNSEYEYFLDSSCGGQGNSTYGRVTAGERLTRGVLVSRCAGTLTGTIGYEPNLGPGGGNFAGADPGHDGSLLVGRFTIRIPTRNTGT